MSDQHATHRLFPGRRGPTPAPSPSGLEALEPRTLLAGDGLSATYYDNADFTGTQVQRVDATVNFNFGSGSPDAGIGADSFSARWTGQVQTVEAGSYTFFTNSDEGVRLWVDDQLLIDNWTSHTVTENSASITLAAATKYDIKVEFREDTGDAVMQLSWQRPGQSKVIIPQANLFALNFDTSWFGNTYGKSSRSTGKWVQQDIFAVWAKPDGTVYANSRWDEGGREAGIYKDGDVIGKLAGDLHTNLGGYAITGNSTHVFIGAKNGYVRKYNFSGSTASGFITVTASADGPRGLAATDTALYISDQAANLIKVYNPATMTSVSSFAFTRPGRIAVDPSDGTLWIVRDTDGTNPPIIKHVSTTGTDLGDDITGDFIVDVNFDNQGRLMVADAGQTQQVKFYNVSGTPTLDATLGTLGGVMAGTKGAVAPLKFNGLTGVTSDTSGNIYVSTNGMAKSWPAWNNGELLSFSPSQQVNWHLQGLVFVDAADAVPSQPETVYTADKKFTLNYNNTAPGSEWTYSAYTFDSYGNPDDIRNFRGFNSVKAVELGGHTFLYMNDMPGTGMPVFRMDGNIAKPVAMWNFENKSDPAAAPNVHRWLWVDADGDGLMESGEFDAGAQSNTRDGIAGTVDSTGDVWRVKWGGQVVRYNYGGLNAHNVPQYSAADSTTWSKPSYFGTSELTQAHYVPETDTMFLAGYAPSYPDNDSQFIPLGRVVVRYDNWSTDASVEDQVFVLPYNPSSAVAKSMAVEGDYLFVGYAKAEQVAVFEIDSGRLVGHLRPGPEINNEHGDLDIPYGINVHKRSNGEYLIFHEDDRYAKQVLYRWTPVSEQPSAETLFTESFNYTLNDSLAGKTGGSGWASGSSWSVVKTGSAPNVPNATIVAPLAFSDYPVAGNALRVQHASDTAWGGGKISRTIGTLPAAGESVWSSYLWKLDSTQNGKVANVIDLGDGSGFASLPRSAWDNAKVAASYGSTKQTSATTLTTCTTYLFVSSYTNTGGTGGGTATTWVLSASQYDAIKSGGITQSELDAQNTVKISATTSTTESLSGTSTVSVSHNRAANGNAVTYSLDEIKYAPTLGDLFGFVNQPPDAVNDSASTPQDTPVVIGVLANDTDPDNDPLSVTGVTQPANGSATYTASNVTFTPNTGWYGTTSFTYNVSDGKGGTDTATVQVTVNQVLSTLMHEGFNYNLGESIVGKNGGTGWNGSAWQTGGSLPNFSATIGSGLSFSSLSTSGQSLKISSSGYANWERSFVTRAVGTAPSTGDTLWSSYLIKADTAGGGLGPSGGGHQAGLVVSTAANSLTGARFQSHAKPVWDSDRLGTAYDGSVTNSTTASVMNGDTYLLVSKFTNVGGSGGGTATMWAINVSQYDLIASGGITEAELDANSLTKIVDTSATTYDLNTSHFVEFTARRKSGWDSLSFFVDELRFGSSLASVTPAT